MNANLARQLLENSGALLLDFDGPMTTLLPPPLNAELARASMQPLISAGIDLPPDVQETTDHLAVTRWTAEHAPGLLMQVERIATDGEVDAAQASPITDGLPELLHRHGPKLVIVTNNGPQAPVTFLRRLCVREPAIPVCGRPSGRPNLMKPSPYLVLQGAEAAGQPPGACVMVGDHASDVESAHAAGARAIGYARSKRHLDELNRAGAEAVISGWRELLG